MSRESMRIAYLVSVYPAPSHAFIRREIAELRRRGLSIETFTVRRAPRGELPDHTDRVEFDRTWSILPSSPWALVRDVGGACLLQPRRTCATLFAALRHRLPGGRGILWGLFHFGEALLLARELRVRGADHLHCHFSNSGGTVAYLAAKQLGIDWSLTLHGSADFDAPTRPLIAEKVASARFAVCVSLHGRGQVLALIDPDHADRVFVSHCGVELPEASEPVEPDGPARIVCVGRLSPEKGHLGLLDAFAQVIERGCDAELRILGEGPERAQLERRVLELGLASRCSMPGAASEEQIRQELSEATCFALSSLNEGLPVALMEAMAAGVPVIAPRIAGIPELIEHDHSGRLFTPTRWEELAEGLAQLIADPVLRRRLGLEGRRVVEKRFEIARAVDPLWRRLSEHGES